MTLAQSAQESRPRMGMENLLKPISKPHHPSFKDLVPPSTGSLPMVEVFFFCKLRTLYPPTFQEIMIVIFI